MSKSLKKKAVAGMIWTVIQRSSKMGISFISGIILARLLTPYDYGCIGMLHIFMTLAECFIDGGFGSALIQKKRPSHEDYSTIFWWNIALATLMYATLFFAAPAISRFYRISELCIVLRVQGLILFIYALNLVQRNQLHKQLKFRILARVTIFTSIIALIVTIILAYKGFGVWALVVQNLIGAMIPAIIFWGYTKWKPSFIFSLKSFKELFSFGIYMFLTSIINKVNSQLRGLLIGRFYNPTTLGYYSKAGKTESLASQTISHVISLVTYPLYAEVQDEKERLKNMIKRLTMTISYLTFPAMFILLLCAKPLFILLYSERWLESVPYFQVMCISGLAICLLSVNLQTIAAIGKSKVMFNWSIIKFIVSISLLFLGLIFYGIWGILFANVISAWFNLFVNFGLVSKYIGYKWYHQIANLLPVAIASVTCAAISYAIGSLLNLGLYSDGIVKFLTYIVLYVGWSLIFKPEAFTYTLSVIPLKKMKKRFGKK